jgi:HTH-type transcriptional regulator / antitoxin HigA
MQLKVIKNKKEYQQYMDWVDEMFDKKVSPASPEGEKLQVVLLLIKQYEDAHYPVPLPKLVSVLAKRV